MNEQIADLYRAAITGGGVVRLDDWSTLRVTGADRASFLHNMCTNDVKGLAAGDGCEAFFTDVKGKTVAHSFLLAGDEALRIVMTPHSAERLIKQLDRYIIREDVALHDESADLDWLVLFGERAAEIVSEALGVVSPESLPAWAHRTLSSDSTATQIVRCPLLWTGGFLISALRGSSDALVSRLAAAGATIGNVEVWQAVRVESAWPLWGVDFDDANLPQEMSRDSQAISFRKGCYLGQETVARIDALGHVNKQLVSVRFEGEAVPTADAELTAGGQPVGRVTSACWSPRLERPIALAMVKRGANAPGTELAWSGGAGRIADKNK